MDDIVEDLRGLFAPAPLEFSPDVRAGLEDLVAGVPRRIRARRRRVAILGITLAAGMVGGTAAADVLTTHTGVSEKQYGVSTGEFLNPLAPDFPAAARALVPSTELAPGQTWDPYVGNLIAAWSVPDGPGLQATRSVRQAWQVHAWCGWAQAWLADPAHDSTAAAALEEAVNWTDLVLYRHDGVGNAVYGVAAAVKAQDVAAAQRSLQGWLAVPGNQVPSRLLGCQA